MADPDTTTVGLTGDERILQIARERKKRIDDHEGTAVQNFKDDIRFAEADARNHNQWPDKLWNDRSGQGGQDRPSLTINKTRVHNNLVINQALKNKSSVRISPTGGGSSYKAAQIMQSLVRRMEFISKASIVYKKAFGDQVRGGVGYALLDTAYVGKTFDQDIYLRGVKDASCIGLDPEGEDPCGLDANYGFIWQRMSREKFNQNPKFRKFKDRVGKSTLGKDDVWVGDDFVLVAKYYSRSLLSDTLITYVEPTKGERINVLASEIENPELLKALLKQIDDGEIDGDTRPHQDQSIKWYHVGGDCIMDRGDWAGKYIPIVRLVGEETYIDGVLDRKGLTRYLIDQQRMLNYHASGAVEFGALQNKAPYVGDARAFAGHPDWELANVQNKPYLTVNGIDEDAPEGMQKIEMPQRQQPPQTSPVYMSGMEVAERHMMAASGQYQSQFGENENAKSGVAINERQEQGDVATFNFNDNQSDFLRAIGIQYIDLAPKIYDTKRIIRITHEDGNESDLTIDPSQKEPVVEGPKDEEGKSQLIFNPSMGEYDVIADAGPNFATQRREAWNAMSTILAHNVALGTVIGDLLFRYGDFPGATDIMNRLQKEIKATKPYLFEDGVTPQMAQMEQQAKQLAKLNEELVQKLAEMQLVAKGKEEVRDIDSYRATTERLNLFDEESQKAMLPVIAQAVRDAMRQNISSIRAENSGAVEEGKIAPDGNYYKPDPNRPGKYLMKKKSNV